MKRDYNVVCLQEIYGYIQFILTEFIFFSLAPVCKGTFTSLCWEEALASYWANQLCSSLRLSSTRWDGHKSHAVLNILSGHGKWTLTVGGTTCANFPKCMRYSKLICLHAEYLGLHYIYKVKHIKTSLWAVSWPWLLSRCPAFGWYSSRCSSEGMKVSAEGCVGWGWGRTGSYQAAVLW